MRRSYFETTSQISGKGPLGQEIDFPAGTMVHPIWDIKYLPGHLRERIESLNRPSYSSVVDEYVMCLVGTIWIPILKKEIREVY